MDEYGFPYLDEGEYVEFPYPSNPYQQVVAQGGNLSPGMLLSAYRQGVFPWFNTDDEPIKWYSLNPRLLLYPQLLHISGSMRKVMKKEPYRVRLDYNFEKLIKLCADTPRNGKNGTWITPAMIAAYIKLHHLGYAHSIECYDSKDMLTGGFYGLSLGRVFFGESMISLLPNASKFALVKFVRYFERQGLYMIDCQQATAYMQSMGGVEVERSFFRKELNKAVNMGKDWKGRWDLMFTDFS
jgi:leucyl/phenylalanyl-tRNA--protein transferase